MKTVFDAVQRLNSLDTKIEMLECMDEEDTMLIKDADREEIITIQAAFVEGVGKDYTGPYEVTPQFYKDILLPTKGSMPKENITVLKVPQYEVTNAAGGTTLILGGE